MANIGKDSESKVNEQTAAASAAPARAAHSSRSSGSLLLSPGDEGGCNGNEEECGQSDKADEAELDRGLQILVVEDVERVVRDVSAAAVAEPRRLLDQPLTSG